MIAMSLSRAPNFVSSYPPAFYHTQRAFSNTSKFQMATWEVQNTVVIKGLVK